MKKLIMAILAIAIFAVACQKAQTIVEPTSINNSTIKTRTNENDVYKTEHGYLKFKDREVFDVLLIELNEMNEDQLNQWEQNLGFVSLYSLMKSSSAPETNLNKNCPDDLLLRIINRDGLIQVGNFVFKSETDLGLCWTLNESNISANLTDLISRVFVPTTMNRFNENLEEDVYDLLTAGTVGVFQDRVRSSTEHKINDDVTSSSNVVWRADCKNVYQAAVFYYSLLSELKYMSQGTITWIQMATYINFESGTKVKFKPNNKPWQGYWAPSLSVVYDNKRNWRPYESSRKLTNYEFIGKFRYDSQAPGATGYRYVNLSIFK
jgi:hypothetical protein